MSRSSKQNNRVQNPLRAMAFVGLAALGLWSFANFFHDCPRINPLAVATESASASGAESCHSAGSHEKSAEHEHEACDLCRVWQDLQKGFTATIAIISIAKPGKTPAPEMVPMRINIHHPVLARSRAPPTNPVSPKIV